MISYGRQRIEQADLDTVLRVLQSDFLTQGPEVVGFEQAACAYLDPTGQKALQAVACNSATSALHVACMALGVGPGDLVWTCANSFAASANCALYCGAEIDFVDIDPATLNMGVAALEQKLIDAAKRQRLPKVVIPVDFAGRPAPLSEIRSLAQRYGFAIVEDASHAIGSTYAGAKVGAHGLADITVFSFHPVKIITTAEGGLAVTANAALARRMALLRSHGQTRERSELEDQDAGGWYYEQQLLGYNYRLTDIQAALGTSQLARIEGFIAERHAVRQHYAEAFADAAASGHLILPPDDAPGERSALHLYPLQLGAQCTRSRREVFDALRAAGIGVNVHYIPIYWHPYYRRLGFARGLCPHAEAYYERAITIPMHASLSPEQQAQVIAGVCEAVIA